MEYEKDGEEYDKWRDDCAAALEADIGEVLARHLYGDTYYKGDAGKLNKSILHILGIGKSFERVVIEK